MKTLKLVAIGTVLFFSTTVNAQVSFNVNMVCLKPWAPDGIPKVCYYYIPLENGYCDIQSATYISYSSGTLVHKPTSPELYKCYDQFHGSKMKNNTHRTNAPYYTSTDDKGMFEKANGGQTKKNVGEKSGKDNYQAKSTARYSSNKKSNDKGAKNRNNKNLSKNKTHTGGKSKKI